MSGQGFGQGLEELHFYKHSCFDWFYRPEVVAQAGFHFCPPGVRRCYFWNYVNMMGKLGVEGCSITHRNI
jgi:hypothetical protein